MSGDIQAGDGNNVLISRFFENGNISVGDGNNTFVIEIAKPTSMSMGNGDNLLYTDFFAPESAISVGNGNNKLYAERYGGTKNFIKGTQAYAAYDKIKNAVRERLNDFGNLPDSFQGLV